MSKVGRPKSVEMDCDFDIERVKIFGRLHATHEEMADYFGVNVRTIERYMADDDSEFCRVYKKELSTYKQKLRTEQRRCAFERQNPTMLIWLGKQDLGQLDKKEVEANIKNSIKELSDEEIQSQLDALETQDE